MDVPINYQRCALWITETTGVDEHMIESSEAFVLVYNVASEPSLMKAQDLCNGVQQVCPLIPKILVANGVDNSDRVVSRKDGKKVAQRLGCTYIEVSAKDDINVQELFHLVAVLIQVSRMERLLLKGLKASLPQWDKHLKYLEDEISPAQSSNALASGKTSTVATEEFTIAKSQTLRTPRAIRHHPSLPSLKKISSLLRIWSPLDHTSPVPVRYYQPGVRRAFTDVSNFLDYFTQQIWRVKQQRLDAEYQIEIAAENDKLGGEASSSLVLNNGEPSTTSFGEEVIEEVRYVLSRCNRLCNEAFLDVTRNEDSRDKIRVIKEEFTTVVEKVAKLI